MENNIKKIREAQGVSAYRLAKELEIDKGCVSRWERNLTQPSAEYLVKMKYFFNTTIDNILGVDK